MPMSVYTVGHVIVDSVVDGVVICINKFLQTSSYISHADQLECMVYDLLEQALGITCSGEYVR